MLCTAFPFRPERLWSVSSCDDNRLVLPRSCLPWPSQLTSSPASGAQIRVDPAREYLPWSWGTPGHGSGVNRRGPAEGDAPNAMELAPLVAGPRCPVGLGPATSEGPDFWSATRLPLEPQQVRKLPEDPHPYQTLVDEDVAVTVIVEHEATRPPGRMVPRPDQSRLIDALQVGTARGEHPRDQHYRCSSHLPYPYPYPS